MPNERVPCEFLLIRYVPDVVKGEFTNIGVVLRDVARPEQVMVRFARSWSRVRAMDRGADTGMLDALEAELVAGALTARGVGERTLLEVVRSGFSNCLQVTEPRACLAESVPAEMDRLMRMYVEPMAPEERRSRVQGRAALLEQMRRAFDEVGAWALMRKGVRAAEYTEAGDPLRLDCGYRPNGVVRLFQAVSLEGELEAAKVLALAAGRLRAGVLRVDGAELELTAVVERVRDGEMERDEDSLARYRFGVRTMEGEGVRVMTTGDLPRMAETARRELHL